MELVARLALCIIMVFYILVKIAVDGNKYKVIKEWELIKVAILFMLLYLGGFFGTVIWE